MTQPVAVPILGQDEPAGQPFGFASPQVFPLSAAEPRTQPTPSGGPAPDDFAPPQTATVPLESIGPTPEPPRNPTEPYLGDAPPPTNTTWRPDQPFTTLNAMPAAPQPSVDPAVLPPPSGPPVRLAAPPAPVPAVNPYPGHVYPVNPYATGPYSYPGNIGPHQTGHPQRNTFVRVLNRANGFVVGALACGLLFGTISLAVLPIALIVSLVTKSAGRGALAGFTALWSGIVAIWWSGYIGLYQLQSTSQLLALLSLGSVLLAAWMAVRPRY